MQPLLFIGSFAVAAVAVPASAFDGGGCSLTVDISTTAATGARAVHHVSGRATGVLNGLNGTLPPASVIAPLGLSMWRGPMASWLWPGRSACAELNFSQPGCCDAESCAPPFAESARLASLGLRQQYILDGIHFGQTSCEWISFNRRAHSCPLPGGPGDPDFALWEGSIRSAAAEAARRGLAKTVYFDVWNEPNGLSKRECTADHGDPTWCSYDANLTQGAFFALYDRAVRVVRAVQPGAKIVAPSIADGGPGINGWADVLPWLKDFVLHANASGTMPDVLSWHVSTVGANGSALEACHAELAEWARGAGVTLPPIGHNEVIGPSEATAPASNLALIASLERLQVEHSCRACYPDPVTKQSPCWDNSLDALLTDDCNGTVQPSCAQLKPRSNYHVNAWYGAAVGDTVAAAVPSDSCGGNLASLATVSSTTGALTVQFARWTDSKPTHPVFNATAAVTLALGGAAPGSCWRGALEWLPDSGREPGGVVPEAAFVWRAPGVGADSAAPVVPVRTFDAVALNDARRVVLTPAPPSACTAALDAGSSDGGETQSSPLPERPASLDATPAIRAFRRVHRDPPRLQAGSGAARAPPAPLGPVPIPGTDATWTAAPALDLDPLFKPAPPWLGADCATSVRLPPLSGGSAATERFLWIFADTLVGNLTRGGAARDSKCMPHNSVGVMERTGDGAAWELTHDVRGLCSPPPGDDPHANGFFVPSNKSRWFWPENGVVVGETLFVFSPVLTRPCDIGCAMPGVALIAVYNPADPPLKWRYDTDELDVGASPYATAALTWPTALAQVSGDDANTLYLLGRLNTGAHAWSAVLARMPASALLLPSAERWETMEWWAESNAGRGAGARGAEEAGADGGASGGGGAGGGSTQAEWVPVPPQSVGGVGALRLVKLFDDAPPETSLLWNDVMGRWVVLAIPFGSPQLTVRTSPSLTGPWSDPTTVFEIPPPWVSPATGVFSYSPKLHPELAGPGGANGSELILTFMSNGNATAVADDVRLYVPQAVRVTVAKAAV